MAQRRKGSTVLVAGGGPAGIAAAVAAARGGVRTLLIERYGFLGGMATAGLVNPFMPWQVKGEPLVGGLFQEMLNRLQALGGYDQGKWRHAFDAETFKLAADQICLEAGVELRLHTSVAETRVRSGRIAQVVTESKSGRQAEQAAIYLDCTGDADLAFRAGVPCREGRSRDGLTQPMTLNFRMANVDLSRMPPREELNRRFAQAKAEGRLVCPREDVLWFRTTHSDVVHFNTTRVVGLSGVSAADLTAAEVEARRQMRSLAEFLVKEIPGFSRAYLQQSASQIGIRETRRIVGDYVLTGRDVLSARKFRDGIARCNYPIDIHSPTGAGTDIRSVPEGDYYEIPYRCLLPKGIDNLLVAGRCISATHEGQSSLRVIPQCFAMGEAAGLAAALALQRGLLPRQLPAGDLRQTLRDRGQIV